MKNCQDFEYLIIYSTKYHQWFWKYDAWHNFSPYHISLKAHLHQRANPASLVELSKDTKFNLISQTCISSKTIVTLLLVHKNLCWDKASASQTTCLYAQTALSLSNIYISIYMTVNTKVENYTRIPFMCRHCYINDIVVFMESPENGWFIQCYDNDCESLLPLMYNYTHLNQSTQSCMEWKRK